VLLPVSSTHNTRIEHLWRNVYCTVTYEFVDIFSRLESLDTWILSMRLTYSACIMYVFPEWMLCYQYFNMLGINILYPLKATILYFSYLLDMQ